MSEKVVKLTVNPFTPESDQGKCSPFELYPQI